MDVERHRIVLGVVVPMIPTVDVVLVDGDGDPSQDGDREYERL
jgi:hypothetical protein